MRAGVELFVLNFFYILSMVYNFRAIAQARYVESIISDAFIGILWFTVVKRIAAAATIYERVGYVLACAAAAGVGIWITTHYFGS